MSDQELIEKSKKISLFLRMKARNNLKKADKEIEKPYLFYVDGYNGKHPVFIFSSFPCSKYCQGFCTPCLYSNIIHSTLNKEKIYNSLITQTDFILKNFDELITQKQTESNHKNLNKVYPNKK